MIKKMSKSAQIRKYVAAHPTAKAREVADALGLKSAYVSSVMWAAKQKVKVTKKKALTDKSNWKQLGLFSSDIPVYEDSFTDTTPKRMAQLAYEVSKSREQVDKYWKAVGEVQKAGLSLERIAELSAQVGEFKARMQGGQIEMFEPDAVNHPPHYKVGGIETIDFIEAKKLGYNLGNVVKYLTRADHKGNRKQDLEKAKWYLERELSATI